MKKYLFNLFKFFTIAFILLTIIEVCCIIFRIPKITYSNIYPKSLDLIPQINSNTILFLGDSRIEWGIKPITINSILNDESNLVVINMAMPNSNGLDILHYLKMQKIYPKIIILGYTRNYGKYTNHNLDKLKYSNRKRIEEHIKYYLKQKFYVFDYKSIVEFIKGKHPIHISHSYDEFGGVKTELYGDYNYKKDVEIRIYKEWSENFSIDELITYKLSVVKYRKWFSEKGTKIIGLTMPTSIKLIKLEQDNNDESITLELFDNYYNYSEFRLPVNQNYNDSIYFLDGSHLTPDFAVSFSQQFAKNLKIEIK